MINIFCKSNLLPVIHVKHDKTGVFLLQVRDTEHFRFLMSMLYTIELSYSQESRRCAINKIEDYISLVFLAVNSSLFCNIILNIYLAKILYYKIEILCNCLYLFTWRFSIILDPTNTIKSFCLKHKAFIFYTSNYLFVMELKLYFCLNLPYWTI